jgi:exopolyphosphatase/guanosine-5'-triphosphate,3'-diphosphate pyrophosphatase
MPADRETLAGDRILNRVRGVGRVIGLDGRIAVA